jgi:hypothetical protein
MEGTDTFMSTYTIKSRTTNTRTVNGINGPETRTESTAIPSSAVYAEGDSYLLFDLGGHATSEDIFSAFPGIRMWKEKYIRQQGAQLLEQIAAPYSEQERTTWFLQREEAVKYAADPAAVTPFCDMIAASRGIPRELFIPKVLENNELFVQASAVILGQQQALIDRAWSENNFEVFISLGWE